MQQTRAELEEDPTGLESGKNRHRICSRKNSVDPVQYRSEVVTTWTLVISRAHKGVWVFCSGRCQGKALSSRWLRCCPDRTKINSIEGQSSLDAARVASSIRPSLRSKASPAKAAGRAVSQSTARFETRSPADIPGAPHNRCHGPCTVRPVQASLKLQSPGPEINAAASTCSLTTTGFCQHRQHGRTKAHVGRLGSSFDLSRSQLIDFWSEGS